MPLDVTCPGCKQRFQVSEKFAGKKGPCPKCKTVIQIPSLKDQVVIHAPETSSPKDKTGRPVFKPISRTETRLSQVQIGMLIAAVVVVLFAALVLRIGFPKPLPPLITSLAAIVLAPGLAAAGYAFLRDDELDPYRGQELWLRLIPSSVVYPLLWGVYWGIFAYLGVDQPEFWQMLAVIPLLYLAGTVTALASLDLEFGQASLHYLLYLGVTIVLRAVAGMHALWDVIPAVK